MYRSVRLRNHEGLEEIYAAHYPRLVAELTFIAGSRSAGEDCANEAFTRLVLHWNKVSRYERPIAWVRKVGYHLAVDEYRRRRRTVPLPETHDTHAEPSALGQYDIWEAVSHLPASHREILVLRVAHGLNDAEIAKELKVPIGTVKSRLSRARVTLRDHLGGTTP